MNSHQSSAPRRGLPRLSLLLAALLALLTTACGGGLNVRLVDASVKKPANVAVFFTVDAGKDQPVGGLTADDFEIYENDELVSKFESKQVILNPEVAAVSYTLLLIDMSGSVTESGQADPLVDAAKSFSDRIGKQMKVGVYAFDGDPKLHSVVPFTESKGSVEGGIEGLRKYKPRDTSTNLHGAVVEALRELQKGLEREKQPLKFGTLVVFSDGTDRANRVSRQDMEKALDDPAYENVDIFAIGVGAEIEKARLDDIGRDGTVLVKDNAEVKRAFDDVAAKVEAHQKRFYLLSYCSPSRRGEHEVTIRANHKEKGSGKLTYKFNSDGFGPNCDPNTPPSFDMKRPKVPGEEGSPPTASAGASVGVGAEAN